MSSSDSDCEKTEEQYDRENALIDEMFPNAKFSIAIDWEEVRSEAQFRLRSEQFRLRSDRPTAECLRQRNVSRT